MKKITLLLSLAAMIFWTACHKDDDHNHDDNPTNYEVNINILQPVANGTVAANQTTSIEAEFTNNATIHNIKVVITSPSGVEAILAEEHVHDEDGEYTYATNYFLSEIGVYTLDISSSGHGDTQGEHNKQVQFTAN